MPQIGAAILAASTAFTTTLGATAATAAGTAVAGTAAGAAASITWGGVLTQLAIGGGLSAISAVMQRQKMPGVAKGFARMEVGTGETGPVSFPMGRVLTPGELLFHGSHGGGGTDRNENYVLVFELSDLPITALRRVWVDGEYVAFKETPDPERGFPLKGFDVKGRDRAWVKFYDGTQAAADPYLLASFPAPYVTPWTATMVGRGLAYAIVTFNFTPKLFASGRPDVAFEVDGIPLYDPRKDSTAGGSGPMRIGRRSTWATSDNPVVQEYNVMLGITDPLTGEHLWGMQGMTQRRLPYASWAAKMDACDALVDGAPRYRCGLEVLVAQTPSDVLEEIGKTRGGTLCEVAGVWYPVGGRATASVLSFDDRDILLSEPESESPYPGISDAYNGIRATYRRPADGWAFKDAPPLDDADALMRDGGKINVASVEFTGVWSLTQTRRLMREWLKDGRRFRTYKVVLRPECRFLTPGDTVSWTSESYDFAGKLFEVVKVVYMALGPVGVTLRERDPNDYDGPPLLDPSEIDRGSSRPDKSTAFRVFPATTLNKAGTAKRPAIRLTWTYGAAEAEAIRYRVRLASNKAHVPVSAQAGAADGEDVQTGLTLRGAPLTVRGAALTYRTFSDVGAGELLIVAGLQAEEDYEVQAIAVPTAGRRWSDWMPVTTPDVKLSLDDFDDPTRQVIDDARTEAQDAKAAALAAQTAVGNLTEDTLSEVRDLVEALQGAGAGDLATVQGVAVAGIAKGWNPNPSFFFWTSGAPNDWTSFGVATYGTRDVTGPFKSGLLLNVPATTSGAAPSVGVTAQSGVGNQLRGADPNAAYVAVEVAMTTISGLLDDFRLRVEWQDSSGSWIRGNSFPDIDARGVRRVVTNAIGNATQWGFVAAANRFFSDIRVWEKPFSGNASAIRLIFRAKVGGTNSAVALRLDALNLRAATEREVASWKAHADAQAAISEYDVTLRSEDGALGAIYKAVEANFADMTAFAEDTAVAVATANLLSSSRIVRVNADSVAEAGIDVVAAFNPTTKRLVFEGVRLSGRNVIAPGTLSAGELVVMDHGLQMCPDSEIQSVTAWVNAGPGERFAVDTSSPAGASESKGELLCAAGQTGSCYSTEFPVRAGTRLTVSAQIGRSGGTAHQAAVRMRFYDRTGARLTGSVTMTVDGVSQTVSYNPLIGRVTATSGSLVKVQKSGKDDRVVVPTGAVTARLEFEVESVTGSDARVRFCGPSIMRRSNASVLITPDGGFFEELSAEEAWIGTLNVRDGAFGRAYDVANTSSFSIASGSWTTLAARTMPAAMLPNYKNGTPRTGRALVSATTLYGTENSPQMEFRCLVNGVQQFYISIAHGSAQVERVRPYSFAVDVRNGWPVQWQCRRTGGSADHVDTRLGMVILFASSDA